MHLSPVHTDSVKENALGTALLKFSEKSRQRLLRLLKEPGFSGDIPSTEVKSVCDGGAKSIDAVMIELLALARTYSRQSLSNYYVGGVARGTSGNLDVGGN